MAVINRYGDEITSSHHVDNPNQLKYYSKAKGTWTAK